MRASVNVAKPAWVQVKEWILQWDLGYDGILLGIHFVFPQEILAYADLEAT